MIAGTFSVYVISNHTPDLVVALTECYLCTNINFICLICVGLSGKGMMEMETEREKERE